MDDLCTANVVDLIGLDYEIDTHLIKSIKTLYDMYDAAHVPLVTISPVMANATLDINSSCTNLQISGISAISALALFLRWSVAHRWAGELMGIFQKHNLQDSVFACSNE